MKAELLGGSVEHATLDPEGHDKAVRLHLHPAVGKGPALLFINGGYPILPLEQSRAILFRIFLQELKKAFKQGEEASPKKMRMVLDRTTSRMHYLYPEVREMAVFESDLGEIQEVIFSVAKGEWPKQLEDMKPFTLMDYAPFMKGPFRMDLAVWPVRLDEQWICNNACGACYAMVGAAMRVNSDQLLTTDEWKKVLGILWREAGVSQVSFTGGEPTQRPDLVELIRAAREFTTRLNTNGRKLSSYGYCLSLKEAELDVVQVTVYDYIAEVHNRLVGAKGALGETLQGIQNALAVELEVSVNIPLVAANVIDLTETIRFLHEQFGVRYFTCSGLLPAGGAKKILENGRAAELDVLEEELKRAKAYCDEANLEVDFTSPGVLSEQKLHELGFNSPICGACLGNMAISPAGKVLPCQSWVHDAEGLGEILASRWSDLWNGEKCKAIREASKVENGCPLKEVM